MYAPKRFFLRVDRVLIRVLDTRLHYDLASDQLLREFAKKEVKFEQMTAEQKEKSFSSPDDICQLLPDKEKTVHRLVPTGGCDDN